MTDVFEIYNCKEFLQRYGTDKKFRVEVHLRQISDSTKSGIVERGSIIWKNKKGMIKNIVFEQSSVPTNRADLFIYLVADEERVGFIRLGEREY
jgi:hypothetical protein